MWFDQESDPAAEYFSDFISSDCFIFFHLHFNAEKNT